MFRRIAPAHFVLACVAFGCLTSAPVRAQNAPASSAPPAAPSSGGTDFTSVGGTSTGEAEYQLGPGDQLELRVLDEPQFDGTFEIDRAGEIEVPFMDFAVRAQCRTVADVRKDIRKELSKMLRKPRVYLAVRERRSRPTAVITGAIMNPQQFQMYRRARLLELVNFSGGITERASGLITVFHTQPALCPAPGDPATEDLQQTADELSRQVPFSVYSVTDLRAGKQESNPVVRPGDIIRIEEATPVYVTGFVMAPQGVYLRPETTLTTVIAQVGGMRREAKDKIKIYRRKKDTPTEFELIAVNYADIRKQKSPDIVLQPYDVIEVGEANPFTSPTRLRDLFVGLAMGGVGQIATGIPLRVLY